MSTIVKKIANAITTFDKWGSVYSKYWKIVQWNLLAWSRKVRVHRIAGGVKWLCAIFRSFSEHTEKEREPMENFDRKPTAPRAIKSEVIKLCMDLPQEHVKKPQKKEDRKRVDMLMQALRKERHNYTMKGNRKGIFVYLLFSIEWHYLTVASRVSVCCYNLTTSTCSTWGSSSSDEARDHRQVVAVVLIDVAWRDWQPTPWQS